MIRNHIAELLTRQDVQNLVNNLKESNPVLVDELIPKLLGLGEVQKVLQNLLSEGISIRDLLTIFETLADHAAVTRDTDVLTEYVRQSLKRAISNKFFPANENNQCNHFRSEDRAGDYVVSQTDRAGSVFNLRP